jgi:aminopeptidase N
MNNLKVFAAPDTEYYPKLQRYIYYIVEDNLKRLGIQPVEGEDANDTKLRDLILGFALYSEDKDTMDELTDLWSEDFDEINPEIRGDVLTAKFRRDHEEDFDFLLDYYQKESNPTIKAEILSTISDAREPKNIEKLINLLKKPEIVRPQDHIYLCAYLLSNYWTRELAFDWIYENWDYIYTLTSDKSMDDYVRIAAAKVRTDEQAEKFFEFFDKKKDDPALKRSIEVAHVDIKARLRWIKDDSTSVRERLKKF